MGNLHLANHVEKTKRDVTTPIQNVTDAINVEY